MLSSIQKKELKSICNSTLFDISIAPYTTFKVGGNIGALCNVQKKEVLIKLLKYLCENNISYVVIGNGSNVLVSDSGFNGVIIRLKAEFEKIEKVSASNKKIALKIGAGVSIPHLLRYCIKNSIEGVEFLAGIPGTIGGATVMNAGAFGEEIKDKIEKVTIATSCGHIISKHRSELRFSYRSMEIDPGSIIMYVWLNLSSSDKNLIKKRISDYLYIRAQLQPINHPSAGCIFKNPEGYHAGKLIDELGLKGKTIGGAMISDKHANFIINKGDAKSADIMALIELVKNKVKEKKGIELEPEIKFIGFK